MRWGRLAAENYRGAVVPRTLGILVAGAAAGATILYASLGQVPAVAWTFLLGSLLVFAAGLVDDVAAVGPRGLRNHLRRLAQGHMTTGVLKLVVTVGAAVVVVASTRPERWWEAVAGVFLVAAAANVWNGLDVRPGRALKGYLPCALPFVLAGDLAGAPALLGVFLGSLVAVPFDLRERAMLGDGGANLLGFSVGLGLFLVLPGWASVAAALAAVGLNVVADTVSFSRVIETVPTLRWVDRLGCRPPPDRPRSGL